MSWQIINTEPAYGICDQCKQHTCGIVDGQHKWVQTGVYDRSGDAIVIGYGCVELWAANLGISRELVEKEVPMPPTDEQVLKVLKESMVWGQNRWGEANWLEVMPTTRDEMKEWLEKRGIPFAKNLSDDKMRELVNQHV